MNAVRLKYLGKTNPLKLTIKWLKGQYTFSSDNDFSCFVEKSDAEYLLKEGPKAFKVISGLVDIPDKAEESVIVNQPGEAGPDSAHAPDGLFPETGAAELPIVEDVLNETTPEEPTVIVEGDGVEGTGPMPTDESGQNDNPLPDPEPPKKGGKKNK